MLATSLARDAAVAADLPAPLALTAGRRARVLLVTNIFPPHIGGPATFIDQLAHELAKDHGCRVTVV